IITYFEEAGPHNTEETIKLARERAKELGIRDIVVASSHGGTALKVAELFEDPSFNIVAVTICESYREKGWTMSREERTKLQAKGIKVFTGIHALGDDVNFAFTEKSGGIAINEVVRQTLYRFCQGMKVCVEVVLMAADAGLIPVDREVIAIAGTDEGADTAIVVKPSYPRKFLDLKIKEIIAKPREG
ncbi:MAG: pyruvate kinase alpha/beta domain-containing protein, partial [Candidatus Bathyarchaeia archaeon]